MIGTLTLSKLINVHCICTEDNPRNPVALAYLQVFLLLGSIRFGTEYIENIALFYPPPVPDSSDSLEKNG